MDGAKKECILCAASSAFVRLGFKKASIDEIARLAGVGKGTIYLAASSKTDLFYQVVQRNVDEWTETTAGRVDLSGEPLDVLPALLDEEVRSVAERPLVAELLAGRAAQVAPTGDERLAELRLLARANLRAALRSAARAGRLRRDLDLEEVAVLLQDLEVATLLFHNGGEGLEDAHYHRWNTAVTSIVEGLDARAEPPELT